MARKRVVNIPYDYFPLTEEIHNCKARFRVLDCGRRFGKTYMNQGELARMMAARLQFMGNGYQPRGLVVAPSSQLVRESWLVAQRLFSEAILAQNQAEMRLSTVFGEIEYKSTESTGGAGRGGGYDAAVIDEAARVPERAWIEDIRPALADRHGRALFTSTPKGLNWFYEIYRRGQDEANEGIWKSWRYTTLQGWESRLRGEPEKLAKAYEEWQELKRTTPEKIFAQEFMADFVESDGQLFRLEKVLRGELRPAIEGRHYVAGLDIARLHDWMVTAVFEVESKQLVALVRSKHVDWALQKAAACSVIDRYPRCHVLADSNGVGDPITQDLANAGYSIEPINVSQKGMRKRDLIKNMLVAFDHGYCGIPDCDETQWLLDELRTYEAVENEKTGNIRYGAPPGKHDDGVSAVMLALWGLRDMLSQPTAKPESVREDGITVGRLEELWNMQDAWMRAYPDFPPPRSPRNIAWRTYPRWRKYYYA